MYMYMPYVYTSIITHVCGGALFSVTVYVLYMYI